MRIRPARASMLGKKKHCYPILKDSGFGFAVPIFREKQLRTSRILT